MSDIKQKSLKMSLKHKDGASYGEVGGYMTTMRCNKETAELFVSFYIPDAQAYEKVESAAQQAVEQKKCTVFAYEILNNSILFRFSGKKNAKENIDAFVSYFYPIMNSCGVLGADYCPVCRKKLSDSDRFERIINGNAYLIHSSCAVKLGLSAATPVNETLPELRKNPDVYIPSVEENKIDFRTIFMGAIGAVLGGLIGAVIWSLVYAFGWVVCFVGFLICYFVIKGYVLFNGEFCFATIPIVFLSVIFSVFWGQILAKEIIVTETVLIKSIRNAPSFKQIPSIIIRFFTSGIINQHIKSLYGFGILLAIFAILMFLNAANYQKKQR